MSALPPLPEPAALVLHTERLDLVPITREHAPAMFEVLNDLALHEYTGGEPPDHVAALARIYEFWEARVAPDGSELWLNWVVQRRESGELIGHMQASVTPDHADVAWVIGTRWQHRGYAAEAARAMTDWLLELEVRKIRASIHPEHTASIKIAERLGLHRTDEMSGIERIWIRADG